MPSLKTHPAEQPRILVYGFQPFLHYHDNITQKLIGRLQAEHAFTNVTYTVLPVDFEPEIFHKPIAQIRPQWVLGMGQYPRGQKIRIERKAVNWQRDKTRLDTHNGPINPQGADHKVPNWSIAPDAMSWRSYNAGRYVCNYSMYQLCQLSESYAFHYAFLHIPKDMDIEQAVGFIKSCLISKGAQIHEHPQARP